MTLGERCPKILKEFSGSMESSQAGASSPTNLLPGRKFPVAPWALMTKFRSPLRDLMMLNAITSTDRSHWRCFQGISSRGPCLGARYHSPQLLSGWKRHEGQRCRDLPKSIFIKLLWVAQALSQTCIQLAEVEEEEKVFDWDSKEVYWHPHSKRSRDGDQE